MKKKKEDATIVQAWEWFTLSPIHSAMREHAFALVDPNAPKWAGSWEL